MPKKKGKGAKKPTKKQLKKKRHAKIKNKKKR